MRLTPVCRISFNILSPGAAVLCLLSAAPILLFAAYHSQSNLKYQDRGDRYEGVRGSPVSDRIELISALMDFQDASYTKTPEVFKLKLYLPSETPIFVTVREIDVRQNYWMDRIRPSGGWRPGMNEFAWSTNEVIKPLKNLKLSDLGAVAQLETNQPSTDMKVIPAALFHTTQPRIVSRYAFAFRISRKANVTCTISEDKANGAVLNTKSIPGMLGNLPRSIVWDASAAKEGWYRLGINVVYRNDNKEINQIVHFYHRPKLN
jgi:hypothetical protein